MSHIFDFYSHIFYTLWFKAVPHTHDILKTHNKYQELIPLFSSIKTNIQIVPAEETTCKRGQEYCVLFYSEKNDNYLQNIGYLGEQLDLYLVSKHIGTLGFGIGKVANSSIDGLNFLIMISIAKIDDKTKFRKNMFKSKRKSIDEIWSGDEIKGVTDIIRFAPSVCNTQPGLAEHIDNTLFIYRYKKIGKRAIMPEAMVSYYNQIDIGIFLCFLELYLRHEEIDYIRNNII